jgi:hypothetical protein
MAKEEVSTSRQPSLKERASDEFKKLIVIVLYLWAVFGLLSIHKSLVLSQNHLELKEHAFAIVNALVFAKVLLIAEYFHFGERFLDKPLIYPILYKSFIFALVLIGFHIAESLAVGVWHGNTIANSFPVMGGGPLKGTAAVATMCFIVLVPFFGFREIGRVIGGRELLMNLIFKTRETDPRLEAFVRK